MQTEEKLLAKLHEGEVGGTVMERSEERAEECGGAGKRDRKRGRAREAEVGGGGEEATGKPTNAK